MAENIRIVDIEKEHSEEEIKEALKKAGILDYVKSSNRIDTLLSNAEVFKQLGIPEMLQPNSVIRFTDEEIYDIIKGSEYESDYVTGVYNQDKLTDVWSTPNGGTYVYYASDGRVNKIQLGSVSETASANARNGIDDQHIIYSGCGEPAVKEGCRIIGNYLI